MHMRYGATRRQPVASGSWMHNDNRSIAVDAGAEAGASGAQAHAARGTAPSRIGERIGIAAIRAQYALHVMLWPMGKIANAQW